MIKPVLQDEAFLADVDRARDRPGELHLWWLGQSGFLVQWQGRHLLIDPYLSDSLTRKYAGTNKPHVRMTERVIAPVQLDFVDVVTSSHNHTDHLDGETLIPLLQANPRLTVIVPRANLSFAAERLQVLPDRLTPIGVDDPPLTMGPFQFQAIPSAHETLEQNEQGEYRYLGYIIRAGAWTLYHSGDCLPYDGLAGRLRNWKIDLALLPINGRDPARGVAGNFSAEEAVSLGKQINAARVVPCHYEMFEFNTVSPEKFIHAAEVAGQNFTILKCGDRLDL